MTFRRTHPGQKRLDRCVLGLPKCAKIRETREKHNCRTLAINNLAPDAAVRVENTHQNGQAPANTKLLGKYQFGETGQSW